MGRWAIAVGGNIGNGEKLELGMYLFLALAVDTNFADLRSKKLRLKPSTRAQCFSSDHHCIIGGGAGGALKCFCCDLEKF